MVTNYPWNDLHPQSGFVVEQHEWISDIDQQILLNLYQPIIGPISYALYFTFLGTVNKERFTSDQISHADIMEQLVLGKEQFVRARLRLESIGLLQVFTNDNQNAQMSNRYILLAPLAADKFFNDSIMSTLLLDRVGEQRYEQLIQKFSVPKTNYENWTETTASFQDVYRVPNQYYILDHKQNEQLVKKPENKKPVSLSDAHFSMPYFTELLQGSFVSETAVTTEVREMTLSLHQIFGYDEVDLQRLALEAADVRTNTINVRRYQQLAIEQAESQSIKARNNKTEVTERVDDNIAEETQLKASQRALWKEQGLDDNDFKIIELLKQYPPIKFIASIKEQRNGIVTKSESNAITDIINKGVIDPPTLNVMVYYYLVQQEHRGLNKSLLETTADDWGQHGVNSPEAAFLYLRGRLDKQKQDEIDRMEKAKYKPYAKGGKSAHVEVKPDWFNKEAVPSQDESQTTSMSVDALKALIAARHKEGE